MPDLDNSHPQSASARKARQRRKNKLGGARAGSSPPESDQEPMRKANGAAVSSSLESIHIPPRTPRSAVGSDDNMQSMEEVEMSLLTTEERQRAATGVSPDDAYVSKGKAGMSTKDKRGIILLIVLCECLANKS